MYKKLLVIFILINIIIAIILTPKIKYLYRIYKNLHKNNNSQKTNKNHNNKKENLLQSFLNPHKLFNKTNINILVEGLDYNYTDKNILFTKGARSDTIMIVNLDLDKKTINVISIPRDTKVYIPGYYEDKINTAYALGGIDLSKKTIEQTFNIDIDYYVIVKIYALVKIIDAIGGLDLYVEKDMNYDDNWGHLHIHLKKGQQHLSGKDVMGYVRFRHDEMGDYGRIERQQKALKVLIKTILQPQNIAKIPELVKILSENIITDLTNSQLLALSLLFKDINPSTIKTAQIPTTPEIEYRNGYPISFVKIDKKQTENLINEYIYHKPSLSILNGNGGYFIATKTANYIEDKDNTFIIKDVADADKDDYNSNIIIYDKAKEGYITQLENLLDMSDNVIYVEKSEYIKELNKDIDSLNLYKTDKQDEIRYKEKMLDIIKESDITLIIGKNFNEEVLKR